MQHDQDDPFVDLERLLRSIDAAGTMTVVALGANLALLVVIAVLVARG